MDGPMSKPGAGDGVGRNSGSHRERVGRDFIGLKFLRTGWKRTGLSELPWAIAGQGRLRK